MSQSNNKTSEMQNLYDGSIIGSEIISDGIQRSVQFNVPYHTRTNPPKKIKLKITKSTKVQVNPFMAQSPQDLLDRHGMYRDESIYTKNPQKIYIDLTKYDNYQDLLNQTISAKEHFNSLDVDVKARFNHNPLEFAKYVSSPDFDINNILTEREQQSLARYLADEKAKADYEAYKQTDEYKNSVVEMEAFNAYKKQQFEDWKKNRK